MRQIQMNVNNNTEVCKGYGITISDMLIVITDTLT